MEYLTILVVILVLIDLIHNGSNKKINRPVLRKLGD